MRFGLHSVSPPPTLKGGNESGACTRNRMGSRRAHPICLQEAPALTVLFGVAVDKRSARYYYHRYHFLTYLNI